jgi:phenylacetate-CoA ligase
MTPWATNAECEHGLGVHVLQDEVWTEIVDKDDANTPVDDGISGAVIYTHLRRESQPMIRFYSGDESHMTYQPCPCGRTYPRLPNGVYGRLDDMLIIRGVNVFPSQIEELILKHPQLSPHYVLELTKDGPMDHLTVVVEGAEAATRALQHDIKVYVGISADVKIGAVERSIGKAKRVIDKRPKS